MMPSASKPKSGRIVIIQQHNGNLLQRIRMYKRRVLRRRKQDVCGDLRLWRSLCLGRA